jgi:peptidoglycan/xylan/chitin deacetylase (PgdA/CDA1 family)
MTGLVIAAKQRKVSIGRTLPMRRIILAGLFSLACAYAPQAGDLLEPALHLPAFSTTHPRVAVTLDACSGDVDHRILDLLVEQAIPVTVFVTERWLINNAPSVAILAAHPDLFDIEDHGRYHVPAVTGTEKPYGITPAGTLAAVDDEVLGGARAIEAAFGHKPHWFRGATALYTQDALDEIAQLGFDIAGFSLNADYGASASAKVAAARVSSAHDGDVIIAHINQPRRASGAGIAKGLLDLKARGYQFVQLGAQR